MIIKLTLIKDGWNNMKKYFFFFWKTTVKKEPLQTPGHNCLSLTKFVLCLQQILFHTD